MKLYQPYILLIFISLTATTIATPYYAKRRCNDTCGNNVTIPYPGMGVDCSVNQWYNTVQCNSSTPYLSALNHTEVLGVNLENQTLTISSCQIPARNSMDLGRSNINDFESCGVAYLMDNGSVVTGCSTSCPNETTVSERNKCFGVSCCQMTIPHHLKSYNMNVTGLDGDGACGFSFLVDEVSYVKQNFSVAANNDSVPVYRVWTLTSDDTLSCCREREECDYDIINDEDGSRSFGSKSFLGVILGVVLVAGLVVMVRTTIMMWVTVLVMLSFAGKSRRVLAVKGRKISDDVAMHMLKVLVKDRSVVAVACAIFFISMAMVWVA